MSAKKQEILRQTEDTIFVLDIGTRSIIGLVGVVEDEKLNIIAIETAEHQKRAMIDGQIEDINAVAKLAVSVKERIEEQLDMKLTRVCVAAAGRALKTERATHELEVPEGKAIDDELINQLESGAIEKIENMLRESPGDMYKQFYLVGYSVVQYYLDEYPISSLLDHHGTIAKADILATFLPSEVVESLYAAMQKAGLEVASLTLEPIAAINAAIPENLRLLNLCFVDIGAGTSDIAICKDGNIVGYTMATIAGDEITEALMREYLIDFDTAEQIKIDLGSKKEIYFTDVMGFEQTLSAEDVLESVSGQISQLCKEIAERIQEVNGGSPSALFLGGGGSKLAGVLEGVTDALEMDEKRAAIAGSNFKATAFSKEYDLNNPEYATPLGIAVSTGLNLINDSCHVTLNGKRAKLFRNGQLNVLSVLTMNGYRYRDLFGRSGASLVVTVDGKRTVFYGKPAINSTLMLNGNPVGVDTMVQAGDMLEFIPAQSGEPAQATVRDAVGEKEDVENLPIRLNGALTDLDAPLKNGDVITTKEIEKPQKEASTAVENPELPEETAAIGDPESQQETAAVSNVQQSQQEAAETALIPNPQSPEKKADTASQQLRQEEETTAENMQMRQEPAVAQNLQPQQELPGNRDPETQMAASETAQPAGTTNRTSTMGAIPSAGTAADRANRMNAAERRKPAISAQRGAAVPVKEPSAPVGAGAAAASAAKPEAVSGRRMEPPARGRATSAESPETPKPNAEMPAANMAAAGQERPTGSVQERKSAQLTRTRREMPQRVAPMQSQPAASTQPQEEKQETQDKPDERPADGSLSATFGNPRSNQNVWRFILNDKPVSFPAKPDNSPYLLLDMLEHSGLDFDNLTAPVVLAVNGMPGVFQQRLRQNDSIIIRPDE